MSDAAMARLRAAIAAPGEEIAAVPRPRTRARLEAARAALVVELARLEARRPAGTCSHFSREKCEHVHTYRCARFCDQVFGRV